MSCAGSIGRQPLEHFTLLFVALGAATDPAAPVVTALDGYSFGLSRRSFQAA